MFEPIGEPADATPPDAEAPAEPSVGADTLEASEQPEPKSGPTRRGVLPPPKSGGKRVQPLAARHPRSRDPQRRPSASGLPSGMRAPGIPDKTESADTDILIASAVAVLTEGEDPADNSSALLTTPDPQPAAATSVSTLPVSAPAEDPPSEPHKRGGLIWFGVAAVAALAVGVLAFSGGGDVQPEAASAAAVLTQDGQAAAPERVAAVVAEPAVATPDPPPPVPEAALDVGDAWVELEDSADLGGELALDLGSPEPADSDALIEDAEDVAVVAAAEPHPKKSARNRKRQRKAKQVPTSAPRPAPAAPAKQPEDAAALLASARKALAAGQARKAYSLASKSRSAKRSSAALVVMAKAACRFGGSAQAKSAFNQLSVSNRRGLRAECRNHGVRLGI